MGRDTTTRKLYDIAFLSISVVSLPLVNAWDKCAWVDWL